MGENKRMGYKYAVVRYRLSSPNATIIHTKHATKRNAIRSQINAKNRGFRTFIKKL